MSLKIFLILFITLFGAHASYADGHKPAEKDLQQEWKMSENKLIAGFFGDQTGIAPSTDFQKYKQDFLYQMNIALNNHLVGGAVSQTPADICFVTDQRKAFYLEGKLVEFIEKKNAVQLKASMIARDCQQQTTFQTDLMSQISKNSGKNAKPDLAEDYVSNLIGKMKEKMMR